MTNYFLKHRILLILLVQLFVLNITFGQVVINEFSASNLYAIEDNYFKTEDWVELYNYTDQAVDLGGWHLSDKTSKPGKWEIPGGIIIGPGEFLLFWCSGRDEVKNGHFHTNFKLSQSTGKDDIILTDNNENIIQKESLRITQKGHSNCRKIDGSEHWRVCIDPTPGTSNTGSMQYLNYTSRPEIEVEAGFYDTTQLITIRNNELNSVLRYTLDGKLPVQDSPIYNGPIEISETTVVKARAFSLDPEVLPGLVDFKTYLVKEDFTVAVFSVAADGVIALANGNGGLLPEGSIEYFDKNGILQAMSYGTLNRHGKDSWVLPHRSIDWVSRDEMGYSKGVMAPLFSYSDRDDYQRFMFRNSGDDNYPAKDDQAHEGSTHIRDEYVHTLAMEGGLQLDVRAVERVVLFLNGQYWGLYGMRERPVDHDYTEEYYDQNKYELHYLTTWGSTKAEYGGLDAFNDWYSIRDFIMENDMGSEENLNKVKQEIDLLSFIDYFIVNLNVVAKDWLNYNTAWWKGLDPEGGHKKWGYVLWDLDATFDYYINYSGVPNDGPDAKPCDIDAISNYMDVFFGGSGSGIDDPENCHTILTGSCPYPPDDSTFIKVINEDHYCCNNNWDHICQNLYDQYLNDSLFVETCNSILDGSCPYPMDDPIFIKTVQVNPQCCTDGWSDDCQAYYDTYKVQLGYASVSGNIGMHEKLLLKLQDESKEFREFYYRRHADLMNTVYTCENMLTTVDSMVAVIEPEMPRQIERWGGSMAEWEENVEQLRRFITERCELLDEGMIDCFDLEGPYEVVLTTDPPNIAIVGINTIIPETLPWSGRYYANMDNVVQTSLIDQDSDAYRFSHWESSSGTSIFSDPVELQSNVEITQNDTLIAVFWSTTQLEEKIEREIKIFPNPASDKLIVQFASGHKEALIKLHSQDGKIVFSNEFQTLAGTDDFNRVNIDIKQLGLSSGVYHLQCIIVDEIHTEKIIILDP